MYCRIVFLTANPTLSLQIDRATCDLHRQVAGCLLIPITPTAFPVLRLDLAAARTVIEYRPTRTIGFDQIS